jgi:dihydropteroate synthase
LNARGRILDLSTPKVMGILNVTPDSFYDGGRFHTIDTALQHAEKMVEDGADIIDIGGMSSRPGATRIDEQEELQRVIPVINAVCSRFPDLIVSVDTVHAKVAEQAVAGGASMINDISAGRYDNAIISVAAKYQMPYVLMHMAGDPENMQMAPAYQNVVEEIFTFFVERIQLLRQEGITDIIVDPGFGFGKSLEHNYALANSLQRFKLTGMPLLVGISRKRMICQLLRLHPEHALNGTTALHAILLLKGADILRVHDVAEAKQVIQMIRQFEPIGWETFAEGGFGTGPFK